MYPNKKIRVRLVPRKLPNAFTPVPDNAKAHAPTQPDGLSYSSATLDQAVELVGGTDTQVVQMLRLREAGLNLAMLGMAEVQSKRLSQLSKVLSRVEEHVFSEQTMASVACDPELLLEYYRVILVSVTNASKFIAQAVEITDVDRLALVLSPVRGFLQGEPLTRTNMNGAPVIIERTIRDDAHDAKSVADAEITEEVVEEEDPGKPVAPHVGPTAAEKTHLLHELMERFTQQASS